MNDISISRIWIRNNKEKQFVFYLRKGKNMIAPCGLDCSKCEAYIATQSGNEEKIQEVVKQWSETYNTTMTKEQILCDGCMNDGRKSGYCKGMCKIPECIKTKTFSSCGECSDYKTCEYLQPIIQHDKSAKERLDKMN